MRDGYYAELYRRSTACHLPTAAYHLPDICHQKPPTTYHLPTTCLPPPTNQIDFTQKFHTELEERSAGISFATATMSSTRRSFTDGFVLSVAKDHISIRKWFSTNGEMRPGLPGMELRPRQLCFLSQMRLRLEEVADAGGRAQLNLSGNRRVEVEGGIISLHRPPTGNEAACRLSLTLPPPLWRELWQQGPWALEAHDALLRPPATQPASPQPSSKTARQSRDPPSGTALRRSESAEKINIYSTGDLIFAHFSHFCNHTCITILV